MPGKATYFTGFDLLRFFAALSVIFSHLASNPLFPKGLNVLFLDGGYAVDLFFVLSGFLITHLLLTEQAQQQRIDLRNFYMRRALRIWPAYFCVLIGVLILFHTVMPLGYWLTFALFLGNLSTPIMNIASPLLPLWTIGAEEQFYTVWGFVLSRKPRHVIPALYAVIGLRLLLLVMAHASTSSLFQAIINGNRFDAMAIGCLAAYAYRQGKLATIYRFELLWWALALGVVLLPGQLPSVFADTAISILFACLLLCIGTKPKPILRVPSARFLGELSFGLYVWHYPVLLLSQVVSAQPVVQIGLTLTITLAISLLSLRLIERPFLRLKVRFQPRPLMPVGDLAMTTYKEHSIA